MLCWQPSGHCWSIPDSRGMRECCWCAARTTSLTPDPSPDYGRGEPKLIGATAPGVSPPDAATSRDQNRSQPRHRQPRIVLHSAPSP